MGAEFDVNDHESSIREAAENAERRHAMLSELFFVESGAESHEGISVRPTEPDCITWPARTVKHERAFEAASNTPR
ncbi:hypothetical protein GCM10027405_25070 [Arthrobacter alkaliphilus]